MLEQLFSDTEEEEFSGFQWFEVRWTVCFFLSLCLSYLNSCLNVTNPDTFVVSASRSGITISVSLAIQPVVFSSLLIIITPLSRWNVRFCKINFPKNVT